MVKIFSNVTILVAVWLGVSGLVLGYGEGFCITVNAIVALCVLALVFFGSKSPGTQWPFMIILTLGILLVLWGIISSIIPTLLAGVNEIIVGLVLVGLSALTLPFQVVVTSAEFHNRHGGDLASFKRVRYKNGKILAKAVLLGSMPETIYMSPEEICKAVALMEPQVIFSIPIILYRGWKNNRVQASDSENT